MNPETEGRCAAERFRHEHRLGDQPLGDLVTLIEQTTGVDVAVLDVGPDEHGLTMGDLDRGQVFVGVARTNNPMRQRSTLAHELGHVIFRDWALPETGSLTERSPTEMRADSFARHLLIPGSGLREFLGRQARPVTEYVLSRVVQRFLVSPAIAAIALHQTGYLDCDTKKMWLTLPTLRLAVRFGWSDQYGALQADADRRRAPQRLLARAIRGYSEGLLPAQAIANLRGVSARVVAEEMHLAGISPVDRPVPWSQASELPEVQVDWASLDEALKDLTFDEEGSDSARNVE